MALTNCQDCSHQISENASTCPQCGCPQISDADSLSDPRKGVWQAVVKSRTPINVFALAMMACAAVFGFSSTQLEEHAFKAFTYCLHMFLAVAGMFFVCLIFCRSAIYHPEDLAKAYEKGVPFPKDRPVLAAILIAGMIAGYTAYQAFFAD